MKFTHAAAIAALLAAPVAAPAVAQTASATDRHDAQCAVVAVALSKVPTLTADQKSAVNSFMMYYLGKLMGRHTIAETKAIINAEDANKASLSIPNMAKSCAGEMTTVGTALQQQ